MRFADIPVHPELKKRLTNMADSGRIPHALLLEGPSGTGKFALARALAQYIHCTDRHDGDSCGRCASCVQHQAMSNIDTHFVFPVAKPEKSSSTTQPISSDYLQEWKEYLSGRTFMDYEGWVDTFHKKNAQPCIYVNESNDLLRKLSFSTHSSNYKIVVMWLPEKMNAEAANKLLKMVEEPYADTLFIMASDNPKLILPTIYSRLQRIKVPRLTDNFVAGKLTSMGMDPTDASAIAHLAEGSMTSALHSLETSGDDAARFDLFTLLMRLAYQRKIADLREWGAALSSLGREKEMKFYDYAVRFIRENFVYNFGIPEISYLNSAEAQFSRNFARFITEANVEKLVEVFTNARTDIAGNANGKIVNLDVAIKVILLLKQ